MNHFLILKFQREQILYDLVYQTEKTLSENRFKVDAETKTKKCSLTLIKDEIIDSNLKYYYPISEYSEPGVLKDTKNIQNEKFGRNQVRCMQE